MALTLLAIPFLIFGVFVKMQDMGSQRCIGAGQSTYCFEQRFADARIHQIRHLAGRLRAALCGRRQIKRQRG